MKLRLIRDWRQGARFISVQCNTLALAILAAWGALPASLQARLPSAVVLGVACTLLVLGIVGRFIDQTTIEHAPWRTSRVPLDVPLHTEPMPVHGFDEHSERVADRRSEAGKT